MAIPSGASNAELKRMLAEAQARSGGGDSSVGVLPERGSEAVGFSSFSAKAHNMGAAEAGMIGRNDYSYFEPWSMAMPRVNQRVRQEMLSKSLHKLGYKPMASGWESFGGFLKQGMREHKTSEFAKRHYSPFEPVERKNPMFFKSRGMNTAYGASGGYLVQPEFAPTIEELMFPNDIADRIKMLPFTGPIVRIPRAKDSDRSDGRRSSGAWARWIDEGKPIPDANIEIDFCELRLKKLAVVVYLTEEIMTDSDYAVEQFVRTKVREEFNFQIGRVIFWGNGGAEPLGFANTRNKVEIDPLLAQGSDSIVVRNLLDMESRFFESSGARPLFIHHRSVIPQIGLLDIASTPVMINHLEGGFASKPAKLIRGTETLTSEFCATLGDYGDIWLTDLNQYVAIASKLIREDLSVHVEFLSDQTALRFIFRFDGRPLHEEPVRPYKAGATTPPTQAPFVTLKARP